MTPAETALNQYLERVGEISPLEQLIKRVGQFYPAPLEARPPRMKQAQQGRCYANCLRLAKRYPKRYWYAEGFAIPFEVAIPLQHAWLVTRDDQRVVDPTWDPPGVAYCGVQVPLVISEQLSSQASLGSVILYVKALLRERA